VAELADALDSKTGEARAPHLLTHTQQSSRLISKAKGRILKRALLCSLLLIVGLEISQSPAYAQSLNHTNPILKPLQAGEVTGLIFCVAFIKYELACRGVIETAALCCVGLAKNVQVSDFSLESHPQLTAKNLAEKCGWKMSPKGLKTIVRVS
jgi:hypothetical protein